jgi:hypothetical protein
MGSRVNSKMISPNDRHIGLPYPPVPTKYHSKNRSVGRSLSYKYRSLSDSTLKDLNMFGNISSNRSNENIQKQINEKVQDIHQKHETMITMQDKEKKSPTSPRVSYLEVANSNFSSRQCVYADSKFEIEKIIHKSSGNKFSIPLDTLTSPENRASMGDVYTGSETIPKYGFRQSSKREHFRRSFNGKWAPVKTPRRKTRVKRIQYSGGSIDIRSGKNSESNRYFDG